MRLRPHHIYCRYFLRLADDSRGEKFEEAGREIDRFFQSDKDSLEIQEGPDLLCEPCPYFDGQACIHPRGAEKAVRKWDAIILEGLGLDYGKVVQVAEVQSLIKQKAPLNFCLVKCRYYRENRCNPQAFSQSG